jgi:homoserine/homoserine lactone efflux protein
MDLNTWIAFFIASCLISVSPGPGAISCMSAGMRYGWRVAVWNIVGLMVGLSAIVAVIGAGVGALLMASSTAFTVLKWIGAVYLVYLGIQQWRAPPRLLTGELGEATATPRELFLRGLFVNLTNPKGIAFLLAVLPQFIDPVKPLFAQYAICAATLSLTDFMIMNIYTVVAANMLRWLREERHIRWMNRIFGGLFVGAGALLVTFKRTV